MTAAPSVSSPTAEVRTIAAGLEFPEGPIALPDGSVLVTEIAAGPLTRVSPGGNVERIAKLGGGPNGAAIGPDGAVYVCNNGGSFSFHRAGNLLVFGLVAPPSYSGGSIDRVDLSTGAVTRLYRECYGRPLHGPNDIVFDESGGFWFTDHGIRTERASDRTGVFYAQPDGSSIAEMIFPLDSPNGIGLSPDGSRLYVAETQVGRIWYWDLDGPGKIAADADGEYHPGKLLYGAPGYALFEIDGDRRRWLGLQGDADRRRDHAGLAGREDRSGHGAVGPDDHQHLPRRTRPAHGVHHVLRHRAVDRGRLAATRRSAGISAVIRRRQALPAWW
jgi:gluconolactonase